MYLGHSFLAFAAVAAAGHALEFDRRRVLVLAGLAAGYGLLPDVDVWRTVWVFLRAGPEGVFPTEQHVWRHSWVVHRALTHSVVTGGLAAAAGGLVVRALDRGRGPEGFAAASGAAIVAVALLVVSLRAAGTTGGVTIGLFVGGAFGLAVAGYRRGATAGGVTAAAGVGLLTHPFGDFWMGRPPAFLFPLVEGSPLGVTSLSPDPVLHFVGAVAVEVALLAVCIHLRCRLHDRRATEFLSPAAVAGLGYAAALGRVPPPTFAEAYQFTTGLFLLAVAVVLLVARAGWSDRTVQLRAFVTGVATFGLGLVGYAAAYALAA